MSSIALCKKVVSKSVWWRCKVKGCDYFIGDDVDCYGSNIKWNHLNRAHTVRERAQGRARERKINKLRKAGQNAEANKLEFPKRVSEESYGSGRKKAGDKENSTRASELPVRIFWRCPVRGCEYKVPENAKYKENMRINDTAVHARRAAEISGKVWWRCNVEGCGHIIASSVFGQRHIWSHMRKAHGRQSEEKVKKELAAWRKLLRGEKRTDTLAMERKYQMRCASHVCREEQSSRGK